MTRRQDLIKQWRMAHAAGDYIRMESVREKILDELKTGRRTMVKLVDWADQYDRKRFGEQHLGPCASCGDSMTYADLRRAVCLKCGYRCDVAKLDFWCRCSAEIANPENSVYYVGIGGVHGWHCRICGGITQTG